MTKGYRKLPNTSCILLANFIIKATRLLFLSQRNIGYVKRKRSSKKKKEYDSGDQFLKSGL